MGEISQDHSDACYEYHLFDEPPWGYDIGGTVAPPDDPPVFVAVCKCGVRKCSEQYVCRCGEDTRDSIKSERGL